MTATQRECRIRSVGRWFCRWRMRTSLSKLLSSSRTAQAGAHTTLHRLYKYVWVFVCVCASTEQGDRSTRPEQSTRILNKINYSVTGDNHRGYIFFSPLAWTIRLLVILLYLCGSVARMPGISGWALSKCSLNRPFMSNSFWSNVRMDNHSNTCIAACWISNTNHRIIINVLNSRSLNENEKHIVYYAHQRLSRVFAYRPSLFQFIWLLSLV